MAAAIHTSAEDAFMADILNTISDDFFNAVPSPDPSPKKRAITKAKPQLIGRRPQKPNDILTSKFCVAEEDVDMAALVHGAQDWDWGDMEADFLSPKKARKHSLPSFSARPEPGSELKLEPEYFREPCTRCVVEAVVENEDDRGRYHKVRSLYSHGMLILYLISYHVSVLSRISL